MSKASQDERTDAIGIAEGIERILAHERHRIAAVDHLHRMADALAQVVRLHREVADELGGDFGVRVGAEEDAEVDELTAQRIRIHERAVMGDSDDRVIDRREVGLCRLPALGACRAVAHMSHGDLAPEGSEIGIREDRIDQAQILADKHRLAVADGDARRFLAPVLQGPEAEGCEPCHIAVGRPDAEDAALFIEMACAEALLCLSPGIRNHALPSPCAPDQAAASAAAASLFGTQIKTVRPTPLS